MFIVPDTLLSLLIEAYTTSVGKQLHLKDKDQKLVEAFTDELRQVRSMFSTYSISPPLHSNMPPVVSKLMWVYGLRQRIKVGVSVCVCVCVGREGGGGSGCVLQGVCVREK